MNNRYITLSVAVLLGLASASEAFLEADDVQKVSCVVYDKYTVYDFMPLYKEEGYTNKGYKVNFCKPLEIEANVTAFAY